MKKLYVGNLDYDVTGDDLRALFAKAGTVTDAVVINDKYSGRSKGFGFVEMSSAEEAKKALGELNGVELNGREIIVREAKEQSA